MAAMAALIAGCAATENFTERLEDWLRTKRKALDTTRISSQEFQDRIRGAFAGRMIGAAYASYAEVSPDAEPGEIRAPLWRPGEMPRALQSESMYVSVWFLEALQLEGLAIRSQDAGRRFARTAFPLSGANHEGRENTRAGIMPPDSGRPRYNPYADDYRFQASAAMLGILTPGLHQTKNRLADSFRELTAYGDGYYGGLYIAGLYTASIFKTEPEAIIRAALASIPPRSDYARLILDILDFHKNRNHEGWEGCWRMMRERWAIPPDSVKPYRRDAKWVGGTVTLSLLFGQGDFARTMEIALRSGQGLEATVADACGVLGAIRGYSRIPPEFTSAVVPIMDRPFLGTRHSFSTAAQGAQEIAMELVRRRGGSLETLGERRYLVVPEERPVEPRGLEQYTENMAQDLQRHWDGLETLRFNRRHERLNRELSGWSPGWRIENCGDMIYTGLVDEVGARSNVFVTYPRNEETPSRFSWRGTVPAQDPRLSIISAASAVRPNSNFDMIVRINGEIVLQETVVSGADQQMGWRDFSIDLSPYAGREATITVDHAARGWDNENNSAFWARLRIQAGDRLIGAE